MSIVFDATVWLAVEASRGAGVLTGVQTGQFGPEKPGTSDSGCRQDRPFTHNDLGAWKSTPIDSLEGYVPARIALRMEQDGLAHLVREKRGGSKGRPGDPRPTALRDHMGRAYFYRHELDDAAAIEPVAPLFMGCGTRSGSAAIGGTITAPQTSFGP